ncbi:hypothetical protein CR513_47398, partial [Mucuna pruriens]
MYQGSRCVEEYFKEMEVTIVRAQIVESQEATMARFLHGLNRDILNLNLGGMERNPTLPKAPTRRVRKRETINALERTKVPRRGVHHSKAIEKR